MKKILADLYTRIFCRPSLRKFNENIVKIGLKGLGLLSSHDNPDLNGELHFLKKSIHDFKIRSIFDVGANKGLCLELGFQGNIYCFEPHPKTFKDLEKKLAALPVKIYNLGFSSPQGKATIFDHMDDDGSEHASLFEGVIQTIHGHQTVKHDIALTTIDCFVKENNIDHIGLLKIDTEGNEHNILVGAEQTLKAGKIDVIHFEFNEMNTISKVFMKDFLNVLSGYTLYRLLPKGFLEITYEKPLLYELFSYQT